MPNPLIILTEETGEGLAMPLALEGLPTTNAAGEAIHYRRMRVVPKPPEGKQWHDVKDGNALDMQRARMDEWVRNTNALITAGRKPFVGKKHDFSTPDPTDTLGYVERVERDADEFYAVVGLHGDESLKIAARNSRSIGVAGKDARDAHGNTFAGEWLHHLAICPNPALPGLDGFERLAASAGGATVNVYALDCGTGAGGFKGGNTCADGGDGAAGRGTTGADDPESDDAAAVLDQWSTQATGSREGEYAKIRKEGEAWVGGKENKGWQDLYDETQSRLKAQGVDSMKGFRGLDIPADHPLAAAIASGKLKPGDTINAEGMALTSWSENKGIAEQFAAPKPDNIDPDTSDRKTVGVVLERVIPSADVIATHRAHTGFLAGESEVIARNKAASRVRIVAVHYKNTKSAVALSSSSSADMFDLSDFDEQRGIGKRLSAKVAMSAPTGPSPLLLALASEVAGHPVRSRAAAVLILAGDDVEPDAADETDLSPSDPLAMYVRDIADRMALKDWTISVDAEPNPNPDAVMSIRCLYGQKTATVCFTEDWAERSPEQRRNDVVHELIHCHGAVVNNLIYADLASQLSPAANEVFQAGFVRAMEYQTDGLAAAIAPLMPLPADDAVPVFAEPAVALAGDYSYASTQFDIVGPLMASLLNYGQSIPDEDLAGSGRETDLHITCKYGLTVADAADVARIVQGFGPTVVWLGDVSVFVAGDDEDGRDYDVVKVDVRGPSLIRLNRLLSDVPPHVDTFPTYVPHLTIAYVKAGLGAKYAGDQRFADEVVLFDQLTFSSTDGTKTMISLMPPPPIEAYEWQSCYGMALAAS